MDKDGHIYDQEAMRKLLAPEGEAEVERALAEDAARLDGYLRGVSEGNLAEAEKRLRERLRAPFK